VNCRSAANLGGLWRFCRLLRVRHCGPDEIRNTGTLATSGSLVPLLKSRSEAQYTRFHGCCSPTSPTFIEIFAYFTWRTTVVSCEVLGKIERPPLDFIIGLGFNHTNGIIAAGSGVAGRQQSFPPGRLPPMSTHGIASASKATDRSRKRQMLSINT
jgi:hypothetical protein